ncbi:protein disulfide oxidoreductase [Shewanella ulleungensis]|nr:protein disulfide oxidoreductase [Shewanella ulleungensis]MCL1152234.1 protein disulfide oxidoreductase [Shewanella ulleungensis]
MPIWITRCINTIGVNVRSSRFWLLALRDLAMLAALLFAVASYLQRDMLTGTAPPINDIVINNSLANSQQHNESEVSFFNHAQQTNKASLVYFWGTWCTVCKVTSPMVNSVAKEQNYQVISVAVASGSNTEINAFMQYNDYQFAVINQTNNHHSQQWGATALPAIYIVDSNNQIRFVTSGVTSYWGMSLRLWFASL